MKKIAISTTSFGEYSDLPVQLCRQKGYEVLINPYKRKVSSNELLELAKGSVGLIAGTESITKETLAKLPLMRVISRCGVGLDGIDLKAAEQFGIKVFNTPDAPTAAVAELTIGLIMDLLRKISRMDASMKNGKWVKIMGCLLCGKKVGILGFGRIGRKVAELLKPFLCEIAYSDLSVEHDTAGLKKLSKEEIIVWADILSIHVSKDEEIIGAEELAKMKRGIYLVNVSRGGIVNEKALYDAIKRGQVSGAALDVFKEEPYTGDLSKLDNVILTPHVGSYAREARVEMEKAAVENLLKALEDQR